jgi:uncharacterized protein YjaZ
MGVIRTDEWLEEDFANPIEMCKKTLNEKSDEDPRSYYRYLIEYGMYKPTKQSKRNFEELKEHDVWGIVEEIYKKYRLKWRGPNIPIYIFPLGDRYRSFGQIGNRNDNGNRKSGLTFPDKLFLFLTPELDNKEIEAIFVHEYHHACRMTYLKKDIKDYTLLDSIVLEGLAEHAVEENCGKEYLAKWCKLYSDEQIISYWKRFLAKNLSVKKDHSQHDHLLFGGRGVPEMLGYAAGYSMIAKYKQSRNMKTGSSFTLNFDDFLSSTFV